MKENKIETKSIVFNSDMSRCWPGPGQHHSWQSSSGCYLSLKPRV